MYEQVAWRYVRGLERLAANGGDVGQVASVASFFVSRIDNLIEKQVDYVVLEQLGYSSTYRYLLPAIQNNSDKFEVIQKLAEPDTYLLRLIKP